MTTPYERRRTPVQAGAFLKELRCNQSVPEAVPYLAEVATLPPSGPEEQADWLHNYTHGAHDGA